MRSIEETVFNALKVGKEYLREEANKPANNLEEHALNYINELQRDFRDIKFNINVMKAELGKAGFEVKFEEVCDTLKFCDSDAVIINPAFNAGGYLNNITICKISKKNSDDVIIKTKAKVAEGDLNIELLGEYLSLARATRIVLGDYNDN